MAQSYDATDLPFAPPSRSSLINARNSSTQYPPPSYPPPSFRQANTETYFPPHHYSQNVPTFSIPQQPAAYYNADPTPVPEHATSYNTYPYPTLPTTVRNDSDHRVESAAIPSAATQPAPAVYHDPCEVAATSSQAPLNDHSRGFQFLNVSAQPQSHSLNPSNNVNFANRAHPLIYDHSSLSRSQTFSDDLPFRPHMHVSTPQMQAAPTPPFDNKHIPLTSDGHRPRSASVETSLYPTPPPAYQELIYTPTPPMPIPQPPQSSSSFSSSHPIAQPLYQEQHVALSLRQQLLNGQPASVVYAPSPLHYSCSADSETGPSTPKKPVKGRSRKIQPPKSPKRRVARTRAKKTTASTTADDASISAARGVSSRDVDIVANSSTATQSGQHSTSAAGVGSSTATASTNKRCRGYLDDTSRSTTATKKRCLEDTGYLIKAPSYIAGRWLSPEAEEKLYSSSPSYLRPLDRFGCDIPLFNILKPERGRTITLGYKIETLGLTHAVSLSSCLNGNSNSLLDSPYEVIGEPDYTPVLTINVVWFGYMNINYMLQVYLNEGSRKMTKAHLAAIIARAYKDIINEHSKEECKQPSQCPVPMLKLGKGGVAFEQIKVTDIQQDEDGIWHPTIYLGCPLDVIRGCLGSEQDISNLDKYYRSISI